MSWKNWLQQLLSLLTEKTKDKSFTRGRLHAKAYIFHNKHDVLYEKGIAIVVPSNLTLAGISHNTELNVVVHGEDNHIEISRWFDELWNESKDFDEAPTCSDSVYSYHALPKLSDK